MNFWPTIELYFKVTCNGQAAYPVAKQWYKVYENGIEVTDFTIWCPDPTQRCAISVALVFDASGSMGPVGQNGNAGAVAAGRAFVGLMDGVVDEATIVFFASNVDLALGMSTNTTDLLNTVNMLPASGGTKCWDGIYAGLEELILSGNNPCRAVIALTDGNDGGSTMQPTDIIALANRNRVRVFTIGLGSVDASDLIIIAETTGGKYYQAPSPDQLVSIYKEISTTILQGFKECVITYTTKCPDGTLRSVDLELLNYCNGGDKKTKTYRASLDKDKYIPIDIKIGDGEGRGLSRATVPLELVTPIYPKDNFEASQFEITYDPACMQFAEFNTPAGTLLHNVPIDIQPMAGLIQISTLDRVQIEGNGKLGELVFELSDPEDSTCCPVELTSWVFNAGCFTPILTNGEICIIPRAPIVNCTLSMPTELAWVRSMKTYSPDPMTVKMIVNNTGDKEAENVRFLIDYDPMDFALVSPMLASQPGTPTVVPVNGISEATWALSAKQRTGGKSVEICITAMMDNHDDVTCCKEVYIPPTEPILECSIDPVSIVADNDNQRYSPMPFTVNVNVVNSGGMKTEDVYATITVPSELELYGSDAPDNNTKILTPAKLLPNQSGAVSWTVWHPIVLQKTDYVLQVWVKTGNTDSSLCELVVTIPPLDAPSLRQGCLSPDSIHFNANIDNYEPNPFEITLTVANIGKMTAKDVSAFLYLPENVELEPATQSLRYDFGTLVHWNTGDPIPTAKWTVKWTKRFREDKFAEFKWAIGGVGNTGIPLDSIFSHCDTRIPGLPPAFACTLNMPGHLGLNAEETANEPNTFTATYTVSNISNQTAEIRYITCEYPPAGIALDASVTGNTQTRIVDKTLKPKESHPESFVFKVDGRIDPRKINLRVTAIDDEGTPTTCAGEIEIDPIKTSLICDVTPEPSVIKYSVVDQEYETTTWKCTAELYNAGGMALTGITAEMHVNDPMGFVQFASGTNVTQTESLVFPGSSAFFTWEFELTHPNTTAGMQSVEFSVYYGSNETEWLEDVCNTLVAIEPVREPRLECKLLAPDEIVFDVDHYDPAEFDVMLEVMNVGTSDASNVQAIILTDGRFTTINTSTRYLDIIPAGDTVGYGDNDGFRLRVVPKAIDGYDEITVVVMADGIPETRCTYPIMVRAEKRPKFQITCTADNNLEFDETTGGYKPNPFIVTTTVKNIGDAVARNCELMFVGPRKFTPAQDAVWPIGNAAQELGVNEEFTMTWLMTALKQNVASSETLIFKVSGTGGLNNDLDTAVCGVEMDIPPTRSPQYELICSMPSRIVYDATSGSYIPDPFVVEVKVRNTGHAEGRLIDVALTLPPRVYLANGNTQTQTIPALGENSETTLTWLLRPVAELNLETVTICADAVDTLGITATCCSDVIIEESTTADMGLVCTVEYDSLTANSMLGDYNENPFNVYLTISNNSKNPINDVTATLISMNSDVKLISDAAVQVASTMDTGVTTAPISWLVRSLPREVSGYVTLCFRVTSSNVATRTCCMDVYIPRIGRPQLDCNIMREITTGEATDDYVLDFDESIGDYEGTPSGEGYTYFTFNVTVTNTGEALATQLLARISALDGGASIVLDKPTQTVGNGELVAQGSAVVSWRYKAMRQELDADRRFEVTITSSNAELHTCLYTLTIKGAPKLVTVTIPEDLIGQYSDKIAVPIYISPTIGKNVNVYKLNVRYNPDVLRFLSATNQNTQTQIGWSGPRTTLFALDGAEKENMVRVEDFTTGSALSSKTDGLLVYLMFEAVFGGDSDTKLGHITSDLEFLAKATIGNDDYLSSMNSVYDDEKGDITLDYVDGLVTISGQCIVPLNSSLVFQLAQNKPNPFNPSTVIEYTVGSDTHVKLDIYDALGRHIRTLVDEFQKAGEYRQVFNASSLPSGTYIYTLETPDFVSTKRMVLMR